MNYSIYELSYRGVAFYIGQTKHPDIRLKQHFKRARNPKYHTARDNKIRKILRNGGTVGFIILENDIPTDKVNGREKHFIALKKKQGIKLTNHTAGGSNVFPRMLSEEHKKKIGLASMGKSWGKHTKETKEKLRKQKIGTLLSLTHRQKISEGLQKAVRSIEGKQKCSAHMKLLNLEKIKICALIAPDGSEHLTEGGFSQFARDHSLTPDGISALSTGKLKTHKGWRLK